MFGNPKTKSEICLFIMLMVVITWMIGRILSTKLSVLGIVILLCHVEQLKVHNTIIRVIQTDFTMSVGDSGPLYPQGETHYGRQHEILGIICKPIFQ